MAFQRLEQPYWYPGYLLNSGSVTNELNLNAANLAVAYSWGTGVGKAGNLSKIHFDVRTLASAGDIEVSVETLNATTGEPTGTLISTGASVTVGLTAAQNEIATLGTAAVIPNKNTPFAVVFRNPATGFASWTETSLGTGGAYTLNWEYNGSTWSLGARAGKCTLEFDDGDKVHPTTGYTNYSGGTQPFNSTDSPNEYAGLWNLPFGCKIAGFAMRTFGGSSYSGTGELGFLDSSDTLIGSTTTATFSTFKNGSYLPLYFDSEIELSAGEDYRSYCKATSTSDIRQYIGVHENAEDRLQRHSGLQPQLQSRTNGGAWSDEANKVMAHSLIITELSDNAGGAAAHPLFSSRSHPLLNS